MKRNFPKRGDIWLVDCDPSAGHEQKGRRPVIITSLDSINAKSNVVYTCPISCNNSKYHESSTIIPIKGAKTTTGFALAMQGRAIDIEKRNGQKIDKIPKALVDHITNVIAVINGLDPKRLT